MIMLDKLRRSSHHFDVSRFHIDAFQLPLFRDMAFKTLTTLHGRQDLPDLPPHYRAFPDMPPPAMAHEFIESSTAKALKVRHLATGRRFTFRVSDPNKRPRFPRTDYSPGGTSTGSVREELEKTAYVFAEREARKAA